MIGIRVSPIGRRKAGGIPGYDVILIAGQSNAAGSGASASYPTDLGGARVKQYAGSGAFIDTVVAGDEPLYQPSFNAGQIGFAVAFARLYAASVLGSGRDILLVPAAANGTYFKAGYWKPGGQGCEFAVAQANEAMALGSGVNRFVGTLFHQGEYDAQNNYSETEYAYYLDLLISQFRSRITGAADSWFILGQMVPSYIASQSGTYPAYAKIDTVHQDTPNRNAKTAFWFGAIGSTGIHYDAVRQRLNGALAFAALAALSTSETLVLPGTATGLSVTTTKGTWATLSWTAPASGSTPSDYKIEYALAGSGSWTEFLHKHSSATTQVVSGLANSTAYDFRVSARNGAGLGPASNVATTTTDTTVDVVFDSYRTSDKTTLSSDDHVLAHTDTGWTNAWTKSKKSSGKVYIEFVSVGITTLSQYFVGIASDTWPDISNWSPTSPPYYYLGNHSASAGLSDNYYLATGFTLAGPKFPAAMANGDVFGLAIDVGAKKAWAHKNGTWLQGDPAAGTSPTITWTGAYDIRAVASILRETSGAIRMRSTGLAYAAPSGFDPWS